MILSLMLAVVLVFIAGAQTPDPSTLPLVQQTDLVMKGSFTVPYDLTYGGEAIAFNPAGPSLFLGVNGGIAEVTIPAFDTRATLKQPLNWFPYTLMPLIGPQTGDRLGGLLVKDGLIGSLYYSFDTANSQERSHFKHSLTLTATPGTLSQVGAAKQSGFTAGFMTLIPVEHQARLGGDALTGQCCISIITRTSSGPAAFAFTASKIGEPVVAAQPLLYYPADHATLGSWTSLAPNPVFNMSTLVNGMAIIPGTNTLIYVGSTGLGKSCYGPGTGDLSLVGTVPSYGGEPYCYDPTFYGKAPHSYPYAYYAWLYNLNDLAAVKAGTKQPWDVTPYATFPLELGGVVRGQSKLSVTVNPLTRDLYLAQYNGEPDCCGGGFPKIHVIGVTVGTTPTTINCTVQSVSAYADKDARLTVRCNTNGKPLIPKGTAFTVTVK